VLVEQLDAAGGMRAKAPTGCGLDGPVDVGEQLAVRRKPGPRELVSEHVHADAVAHPQ
jgi:hypothetical protein